MFMAFSGRAPNLASRILLGLLNHDRGALRFRCAAGRHSVAELDENWFAVGGCDGGGATRRVVAGRKGSGRLGHDRCGQSLPASPASGRKKPPSRIILSQTSAGNTPCDARCFSEDDGRDMRGPRRRAGLRQSGPLLRNGGWGSERARAGAFQDRLILGAVVELLRNFDRRKFRDY